MSDQAVYGFDFQRATILKALADEPTVVSKLNLTRRGLSGAGGAAMIVLPPAGGIPAAQIDGQSLVLGHANCRRSYRSGNVVAFLDEVVRVHNSVNAVVGRFGPVQVKRTEDGLWLVDVEICTQSNQQSIPSDLPFDAADDDDLYLSLGL